MKRICLCIMIYIYLLNACAVFQNKYEENLSLQEQTESETAMPPKPEIDTSLAELFPRSEDEFLCDYEYDPDTNAWDYVLYSRDVKLKWRQFYDQSVILEWNEKKILLDGWVMDDSYWTVINWLDMNHDGIDELVLNVDTGTDIYNAYYIYDLQNNKDLTPFYGKSVKYGEKTYILRHYLKNEYAVQLVEFMNEECMKNGRNPYFEPEEEGGFDFSRYGQCSMSIYDEDGTILDGQIKVHFYLCLEKTSWQCNIYFAFDETGCRIEKMEMTFYD